MQSYESCAPMQSYECVTFEDYPLRFYDDGKTPKIYYYH